MDTSRQEFAVWGVVEPTKWKIIRVRGLPERRMEVPVCGTGRGLDNDAGFVVVVLVLVVVVLVVPSPWPPPGPAHNRISL